MKITRNEIKIGFQCLLERLYEEKEGKNIVEDVFGFENYSLKKGISKECQNYQENE